MITNIYFFDTVDKTKLAVQCVPKEVEYKPNSAFATISSPGRNNPIYHFTGSEDEISFELDWYSEEAKRMDVIKNCRWLEARSKNNGNIESIHPILLIWGGSLMDNESQAGESWLISAAPYRMVQFDKMYDMYPVQAYQTITLKRITVGNRTYSEIGAVKEPFISKDMDDTTSLTGTNVELGLFTKKDADIRITAKIPNYFTDPNAKEPAVEVKEFKKPKDFDKSYVPRSINFPHEIADLNSTLQSNNPLMQRAIEFGKSYVKYQANGVIYAIGRTPEELLDNVNKVFYTKIF